MSRSIQPARRLAAAVAVGATALLATACSAGQTAQTAVERSTVDGSAADVGMVALRNVRVAYPANGRYTSGSSAPLEFAAVNTGMQADQLISVRANVASTVVVHPAGGSESDSATPTETVPTTDSATPSGTGSASGTASGTATPSGSAGTSDQVAVELPPGTLVVFSNTAALVQLQNLAADLIPGQIVQVTFTFAKSGTVTVPVPVATPDSEVQKAPPVTTSSPTEAP